MNKSFEEYVEVPNAPCGVESGLHNLNWSSVFPVPNAPCGVESISLFTSTSNSLSISS